MNNQMVTPTISQATMECHVRYGIDNLDDFETLPLPKSSPLEKPVRFSSSNMCDDNKMYSVNCNISKSVQINNDAARCTCIECRSGYIAEAGLVVTGKCDSDSTNEWSSDSDEAGMDSVDGFYNVPTNSLVYIGQTKQKESLFTNKLDKKTQNLDEVEDLEAEFDLILRDLQCPSPSQETYVDRLAGRRDRFGFILSPVIEAPSPTPSSLSGYSEISCSSPDPFGVFRMSPGLSRGSKQEMDLSSLCVKPSDWEFVNETQTVPIYQMVQAKRAIVIPEGIGWESGGDLLSGSREWDASENGPSSQPISTTRVNLTQFGTYVTEWKEPDTVIYEETEGNHSDTTVNGDGSDSDTTLEDDSPRDSFQPDTVIYEETEGNHSDTTVNGDGSDSDTTLEDDSPRDSFQPEIYLENCLNNHGRYAKDFSNKNNDDNEMKLVQINNSSGIVKDETMQVLQLSFLENEINNVDNELKRLKLNNDKSIANVQKNQIVDEFKELALLSNGGTDLKSDLEAIEHVRCLSITNSLEEIDFNAKITNIVDDLDEQLATFVRSKTGNSQQTSSESQLDNIRIDSRLTCTTTDNEGNNSTDSEDAEDELSDSSNDDFCKENDFQVCNTNALKLDQDVQFNALSCKTPESVPSIKNLSRSSTIEYTSDEDVPEVVMVCTDSIMSNYGSDIRITQYTSEDSDESQPGSCTQHDTGLWSQNNEKLALSKGIHDDHSLEEQLQADNNDKIQHFTTHIHNQIASSFTDSVLHNSSTSEIQMPSRTDSKFYYKMNKDLPCKIVSKYKEGSNNCSGRNHEFTKEIDKLTCGLNSEIDRKSNQASSSANIQLLEYTLDVTNDCNRQYEQKTGIAVTIKEPDDDEILPKVRNQNSTSQKWNGNKIQTHTNDNNSTNETTDNQVKINVEFCDKSKLHNDRNKIGEKENKIIFKNKQDENDEDKEHTKDIVAFIKAQDDGHVSVATNHTSQENCPKESIKNKNNGKTEKNTTEITGNDDQFIARAGNAVNHGYANSILRLKNICAQTEAQCSKLRRLLPVKIQVSHLKQTGSARCKVKHGYVHELSEFFNNRIISANTNKQMQKSKKVKQTLISENLQKPEILTPNENLAIDTSNNCASKCAKNDKCKEIEGFNVLHDVQNKQNSSRAVELNEGIGLSINPLELVAFDKMNKHEIKTVVNKLEDISKDDKDDDVHSIESKIVFNDNAREHLQQYENQLCEMQQNNVNYNENFAHDKIHDFCRKSDTEGNILDQSSDNQSEANNENEIEERIDGNIDANQSGGEEFRGKYHLSVNLLDSANNICPYIASDYNERYLECEGHGYEHCLIGNRKDRMKNKNDNDACKSKNQISIHENAENYNLVRNAHVCIEKPKFGKVPNNHNSKSITEVNTEDMSFKNSIKSEASVELCPAQDQGKEANNVCSNSDTNCIPVAEISNVSTKRSTHQQHVTHSLDIQGKDGNNKQDVVTIGKPLGSKYNLYDIIARLNKNSLSDELRNKETKNVTCKGVVNAVDKTTTIPKCLDRPLEHKYASSTAKNIILRGNGPRIENDETDQFAKPLTKCDPSDSYQIRHPATLSQRLYGPHCILKEVHNERNREQLNCALNVDATGEVTSTSLLDCYTNNNNDRLIYPINVKVNAYLSSIAGHNYLRPTDYHSRSANLQQDYIKFDTAVQGNMLSNFSLELDKSRKMDPETYNSQKNICNPKNVDNYYDVKTPLLKSAHRNNNILSNAKSTFQERNETKPVGECKTDYSGFVVNPMCVNTDAKCGICKSNSLQCPCQNAHMTLNTNETGSIHFNNGYTSEQSCLKQSGVVNDPSTSFNNSCRLESLRETANQNEKMNISKISAKDKTAMVKGMWKRCNDDSSSATKETIYSPQMSSGNALNYDKPTCREMSPFSANSSDIEASVVPCNSRGYQHVLEDEKGKLKIWPYTDFEDCDKLSIKLHKARKGITFVDKRGMPGKSKMTIIQSSEHSAEMPENRVVQKYKSSAQTEGTTAAQILKAHGESMQSVLLQDGNANAVSDEELAVMSPKISEAINKLDHTDAQEILPGLSQSIPKLENGGSVIIATVTRELKEEDNESSGWGSPEPAHPVLNVDDLENNKIYLVRDSKVELFYVEDVTSETHESAYFSSSMSNSEGVSGGNSPISERISKPHTVGNFGINESTAKEIIDSMYGDSDVREITENEEEWNERTYEYDIPRSNSQQNYSKNTFNTSYMDEEPGDTLPRSKAVLKDQLDSSYAMTSDTPWLYDSGMAQRYSQMTGICVSDEYSASAISTQNADVGISKTIERYTVEAETTEYPNEQTAYASTQSPICLPPVFIQAGIPQYSLVKVDTTPKEKLHAITVQPETSQQIIPEERPIYKTVAHIQTRDKLPSPKHIDNEAKRYKIITSKASQVEEVEQQESHMRFDEADYKFSTENIEHKMSAQSGARTQFFVRSSSNSEPQSKFRSEQHKNIDQKFKSDIEVKDTKTEMVENSNYSYDDMKATIEQTESNIKVVRGSYLIKNTLDNADSSKDDNINMFDGKFTLWKDNPLYKSDEDLYRKLDRDRTEQVHRQDRLTSDVNQDLTFENVDRFSKFKTVNCEPEKPKQSVTQLLLEHLSTINKKDIRQHIDVKHHSEDIYGDPKLAHADGESSDKAFGTGNFDTVGEKVDFMINNGKAYITVNVTAERITPVDLEFNVWRKNQAIVTRTTEIDLLATEQRRRFYYQIMQEPSNVSHRSNNAESSQTVLDSQKTLELFTKILYAADGEGDKEDIEEKTKSGKTTRPFPSGMDILF